jgi:hypothetical protein
VKLPHPPASYPPVLWIFIRTWRTNMWFLAGEILKISMHYETNFQGCISINTWYGEAISTALCLPRSRDDTDGTVTTLRVGSQRNRCSICGLDYEFKFSSQRPDRIYGRLSLRVNVSRNLLHLFQSNRDVTLTFHPISCRGYEWMEQYLSSSIHCHIMYRGKRITCLTSFPDFN